MLPSAANGRERLRAMVLLPPGLCRRHALHGDHDRARPTAGRPQRRRGVEVYPEPAASALAVGRTLPRPIGGQPSRGRRQGLAARTEAGAGGGPFATASLALRGALAGAALGP